MLLLATKVWEQRKLGEIGTTYSGLSGKNKSDFEKGDSNFITFLEVLNNPILKNIDLTNKVEIKENEHQNKVKRNDILFNTSSETPEEVATSTIVDVNQDNLYLNSFCFGFRPNVQFSNYYIGYYLRSNHFRSRVFCLAQGISRYNISKKSLIKLKLSLPKLEEQDKISRIFNQIELLLTLYERKTRLLSKLRTFLTQRLFSNSSKVSLYFDNKNWSKHKISEFLTERNEKVIPNPSIPLVSFTVEKGVTPKSKRYNREFLVKDDKKKYKITKKNDIVYNPANLKFGAIARNKFGNAAFSPIYVTFITKLNPVFTEFLVRRKDFIKLALKYQEGTVYERMAVKSKDFLSLKIYLPNSSRDINYIAQILQSLDTLVSLNKNKISLITLIKKELLNTMFI